jgi:hypothetical protein
MKCKVKIIYWVLGYISNDLDANAYANIYFGNLYQNNKQEKQ